MSRNIAGLPAPIVPAQAPRSARYPPPSRLDFWESLWLAQEIRRAAFEVLLDGVPLRDRLKCLPAPQREPERASAMRLVIADERRAQVLLFRKRW